MSQGREEHVADHGHSVVAPLMEDLRRSLTREPGLSIVACAGDAVFGHVLFTRNLLDAGARLVDVAVLSPVAVLPEYQRRGIGADLIERGVAELGERGVRKPSLRTPDAAFQVRLLRAYEPWMTGTLVYRQTFWDHDAVGLRAT